MTGKKFQFKLEAVLKLRHHETELARRELGVAMAAVSDARSAFGRAHDQLEELLSLSPSGNLLSGMRRLAEMRSAAIDTVDKANGLLTENLDVEALAREQVFDRLKREEALEKLKSHQRDEFEAMHSKAEQLMLDEFSVIGHVRKKLSTL